MTRGRSIVRVLVPTTAGLVEIERLIEEQIDRSVICVGASTLHNPRLDKAYSDFIAAGTGVIERLFRHGSFRLEVSQEIDHGSSWQLGVFIAHALHDAGRLAEKDQAADTIVWATGEVRYDLSVAPVGHVEDKLRLSMQHLQSKAAAGHRVILALPKSSKPPTGGWLPDLEKAGIEVFALERVHELVKALGLTLPAAAAASDDQKSQPGSRRKYFYLGGVAAVLVAAVLVVAFYSPDDRAIVLTLPKTRYVIGEPFSFSVRGARECPFYVLTIDTVGEFKLHDPAVEAAFMGDAVLKAGERRKIPVQGVAVVDPPVGIYQIAAVCKEDLARLGFADSAPRNRRNFRFKMQDAIYTIDRDELNKLAVSYEVKDK